MESLPHAVTKIFGRSEGTSSSSSSSSSSGFVDQMAGPPKKLIDIETVDAMYGPRSDCFVCDAYPEVKKAFIRRVYQILVAQLVLTAAIVYAIRGLYNIDNSIGAFPPGDGSLLDPSPSHQQEQQQEQELQQGQGQEAMGPSIEALSNLFWCGFLGSMISLAVLHFVARRHPHNLAALLAFTCSEALLLSSGLMFVPAGLLFRALLTTTVVFIGLILYTLKSKTDYSFLQSYLGSALWIIIAAGFFQLFWPMGSAMDTIYTWLGALVFCGFIIYDTWRLHFQLKPDEYVLAAVSLYLDFINLFLRILHLLSKKK